MEPRPGTKGAGGLSIQGSTPPSRAGCITASGARTGKATESPLEVLTHALIKKMRERFAELSNDVTSQEIIANEVTQFMLSAGSVREEDLSRLEDRIRSRLSGDTPIRNSLAALKRAQQDGDEWAKIYALHALAAQVAEKEAKKRQEQREELDYAVLEQADLKEWEAAEAAKRALQKEIMEQLKADRAAQLAERNLSQLAARVAYEAKSEFEKEEADRKAAKEALKAFLMNNESLKLIKEQAKQAEWAADQAVMAEYAAQMEKQEAARKAQLEKIKAWQAAQEREAAARPEAKHWIDPALLEKMGPAIVLQLIRYSQQAEAAAAAEEERRKAALKASVKNLAASLDDQVKLKSSLKHGHEDEEQAAIRALREGVAAEQERRTAEKAAGAASKAALKVALEEQMKLNATRKTVAPMSDTEKLINKQLLEKVALFVILYVLTLKPAALTAFS
eukprot:gene9578-9740_t